MKHCGYCGREIPESAAFCSYCGKPQGRAAAGRTASAAKKYCGKCGKAIPAAARFCPYCGDRAGAAEAGSKRPEKPARPGKASRPPKKRRWIAAVAAALVVCIGVGGFLAYSRGMLDRLFNPSAKYHTEENGYVSDGKEMTYASPTDESHLKPVVEGNDDLRYADNELIVQLANPTTEAEARRIARENGAELVGFISVSGTCQWRLQSNESFAGIAQKCKQIESAPQIQRANYNFCFNMSKIGKESLDEDVWLKGTPSWGYKNICADYVLENYKEKMVFPINIGVIDMGFQKHYDLEYYSFDDSDCSAYDELQHGTHVSGIIMANSTNHVGMRGVYPNPDGAAKLFTFVEKDCTGIQSLNALARMILSGCKAINHSVWYAELGLIMYCWDRNLYAFENYDRELSECFIASAQFESRVISSFIDAGYEFLLVQIAGNGARRFDSALFYNLSDPVTPKWYDIMENVKVILGKNGPQYKKDSFIDTNKDMIPYIVGNKEGVLFTGNYPSTYNSPWAAIEEESVRSRIMVVGAYGKDNTIRYDSNMDERVDIMAPGDLIYSTAIPTEDEKKLDPIAASRMLVSMSGTSMAAPFVTGAAACIWSLDKTLTAEEVRSLLLLKWPKPSVEGVQQAERIKQANNIVMISDGGYSGISKPALNLKASMELAESYIAWKTDHGKQTTEQNKKKIVKIRTFFNDSAFLPTVETSQARLKIVGADGTVYAEGIGTDYTEKAEDANPVYKPEESAFYIALPDGEYTVEITLKGYEPIHVSGLDPRNNYNETQSPDAETGVIWCFVL